MILAHAEAARSISTAADETRRRLSMAMHVVMVEPEIPPNTGNVARSCAATGSILHLVKPLGFSIDDKSLKRAGLDYWPYVEVEVHESLEEFMSEYEGKVCPETGEPYRMFLATTKGSRKYTDVSFRDGDMILFGRETAGLDRGFIDEQEKKHPGCAIRIPMSENTAQVFELGKFCKHSAF